MEPRKLRGYLTGSTQHAQSTISSLSRKDRCKRDTRGSWSEGVWGKPTGTSEFLRAWRSFLANRMLAMFVLTCEMSTVRSVEYALKSSIGGQGRLDPMHVLGKFAPGIRARTPPKTMSDHRQGDNHSVDEKV